MSSRPKKSKGPRKFGRPMDAVASNFGYGRLSDTWGSRAGKPQYHTESGLFEVATCGLADVWSWGYGSRSLWWVIWHPPRTGPIRQEAKLIYCTLTSLSMNTMGLFRNTYTLGDPQLEWYCMDGNVDKRIFPSPVLHQTPTRKAIILTVKLRYVIK